MVLGRPSRSISLLMAILSGLASLSCSLPLPNTAPMPLRSQTICNKINDGSTVCRLEITIAADKKEVLASLRVEYEDGLVVNAPSNPGYSVTFDRSRRQMTVENIGLLPNETRKFSVNCEANPEAVMSGAFVITSSIELHQEGKVETHATTETVYIGKLLNEKPRVLLKSDYDKLIGEPVVAKSMNLSYQVELGDGSQPNYGRLLLKYSAVSSTNKATFIVRSRGGILFQAGEVNEVNADHTAARVSMGAVTATGSRLVGIPFEVNPSSNDGIYALVIDAELGASRAVEQMAIAVELRSSSAKSGAKWLELRRVPVPDSVPSPTATSAPLIDWGGLFGAKPTPTPSPTPEQWIRR